MPGSAHDEAAALVAAVLACGDDGPSQDERWSSAIGLPVDRFPTYERIGIQWQAGTTPRLAGLAASDRREAQAYAKALAELASAAAAVKPLDLRRVNAAAFTAAAQLRALAPEHGHIPPGSVVPITRTLLPERAEPEGAPQATGAETSDQPADSSSDDAATYEQLLGQLEALVGLESVKAEVRQQAELLRVARIRAERGLRNPEITRHLVFAGNPGTGKTTVARLVAKIYRSLGLLEKGHLVELDRSGLVGGYLGQTEARTAEAIDRAIGGVLFLDEAYSLAGDQYGDVAVSVLVKAIEDHRDDLVLIAAGYTDRMREFLSMNPGLASRLRLTIEFPDYTDEELEEIFVRLSHSSDFEPTGECLAALREVVVGAARDETFGNARLVRRCFEAALVRQAWRLRGVEAPTDQQLRELVGEDIAAPVDGAAG